VPLFRSKKENRVLTWKIIFILSTGARRDLVKIPEIPPLNIKLGILTRCGVIYLLGDLFKKDIARNHLQFSSEGIFNY